jgi:polysaccharide export outer membrane protein
MLKHFPTHYCRYCLVLSALLIPLSSICSQTTDSLQIPTAAPIPEVRSPMTVVGGDYILRPKDVIAVTVYGEPELAIQDRLVADGSIMMPLVGRIRIGGRTSVAAAETIRASLAADYLVNPQVSVSIIEAAVETFTVIGKVTKPGSYPLPPGSTLSLLEAIGMAGGFAPSASPGRITVKRRERESEVILKVDGKSQVSSTREQSFQIKPGDVINVPQSLF